MYDGHVADESLLDIVEATMIDVRCKGEESGAFEIKFIVIWFEFAKVLSLREAPTSPRVQGNDPVQ